MNAYGPKCSECQAKDAQLAELKYERDLMKHSLTMRTDANYKLRRRVEELTKELQANDPMNPQRCN
jgi:predicted nuclease with TOPRIM domain